MLIIPPIIAVAAFDEGNKRMHLAIPPAADHEFANVESHQGCVDIPDHTMPVDRHDSFYNVIDNSPNPAFACAQFRCSRRQDTAQQMVPNQDADKQKAVEYNDTPENEFPVAMKSRLFEGDPFASDVAMFFDLD